MTQFDPNILFGLKIPIIQAPMAGVSTPELAAAVSNAGSLGSISIGASSLKDARAMIEKTRSLTNNPFNVNVFCHQKAKRNRALEHDWIEFLRPLFKEFGGSPPQELQEIYRSFLDSPEVFEMILEQRPSFVSFHFGIPSTDWIGALRAAGIKTLASATNVHEAELIMAAGIDGIIAQGIEAGGHRGVFYPEAPDDELPTLSLVKRLKSRCNLPIIAAGGIMNGRSINQALSCGASGVQLGTAFILCPESSANSAYRYSLKNASPGSTRLTSAISGRPARGLVNRFMTFALAHSATTAADYPLAYDIGKQLNALAVTRGNNEFSAFWAGEAAPLSRELTAKQLIETLLQEMRNDNNY